MFEVASNIRFGGKADIFQGVAKGPLIAIIGHRTY